MSPVFVTVNVHASLSPEWNSGLSTVFSMEIAGLAGTYVDESEDGSDVTVMPAGLTPVVFAVLVTVLPTSGKSESTRGLTMFSHVHVPPGWTVSQVLAIALTVFGSVPV